MSQEQNSGAFSAGSPSPIDIPRNWTFEKAEIAAAFDRHVREQLPWYDLATGAIAHIARHYIPTGGLVYDIGASTGNIGRALSETLKDRRARLVAIEAAAEMVARYDGPGEVMQADAMAFDFEPFDLGVCFLLLMFLPVSRRAAFVQKLRQRIKPGGALIVFDKCEAATGYPATVLWRLTLAGKVSAGVDPAEIVAKELSLGGVQRPITADIVGGDAIEWFRFGEFAGWLLEGITADHGAAPG
ncbi:class I SAM-dependent methyltransferase [Azospirillum sp. Marseille-Q6669]